MSRIRLDELCCEHVSRSLRQVQSYTIDCSIKHTTLVKYFNTLYTRQALHYHLCACVCFLHIHTLKSHTSTESAHIHICICTQINTDTQESTHFSFDKDSQFKNRITRQQHNNPYTCVNDLNVGFLSCLVLWKGEGHNDLLIFLVSF